MMDTANGLTCLTGGTGYIGGRLLALLEDRGRRVRCLTRRPEALQNRVRPTTEVVCADVLDRDSLSTALDGVETAYYLVHNMGSGKDFEQKDRQGAVNFAAAAQARHVKRIIYLGGLGDPSHRLSAHLRSRQEVELFFDGLELLDPLVTAAHDWRPETPAEVTGEEAELLRSAALYAGVGRKP